MKSLQNKNLFWLPIRNQKHKNQLKKMKLETENFIIKEFERKRNLRYKGNRLFTDLEIIENLKIGLSVQKSKILEILDKHKFKVL